MDKQSLRHLREVDTVVMTERHDLTDDQREKLVARINSQESLFILVGRYIVPRDKARVFFTPYALEDINIPATLEGDELILRSLDCRHLDDYRDELRKYYNEVVVKN